MANAYLKDRAVLAIFISALEIKMKEIPVQSMPRQGEYMACVHGHKWSMGLITKVVADDAELKVDFLHQSGPSNHFKWPERTDMRTVSICDLLLVIDAPLTRNGRTFSVIELIVRKINEVFSKTC